MVGIVKNHLMMFTRNLVGIPMGFGFQNEVTNPKVICPFISFAPKERGNGIFELATTS